MNSDTIAIATLATYAAIVLFLVWISARQADGRSMWILYIVERLFMGFMMKWRANNWPGPHPIPAEGPALIISNHRSPVDPMFLWMSHTHGPRPRRIRCYDFMMASEYMSIPGISWLTTIMKAIPVDRDGKDMAPTREAIRRLKNGRVIVLFPEGRINMGTDLMEPNPGIAFLALKAKVPVYPIYIHDAPQDGESMIDPFFKRCRVRVTYGAPIDLSEHYGQRLNQDKLAAVTNQLMRALGDLGGVGYTPVGGSANGTK